MAAIAPRKNDEGDCYWLALWVEGIVGHGGCCRRCGSLPLLDWRCGAGWTLFAGSIAAAFFAVGLDDRAHPVVSFGIGFDAVYFAFEAGEALAELFHGEDEFDDRAFGRAKTFAGHGHGDAWGIGNEHDGGDAAGHLGEANFFRFVT
jgi:hypothetical protein